ncbi:MAG: hypothetical protein AABW67_02325 [Nanoarchaeota archaeon]
MNRLQIGLKLGLDALKLPITPNIQITQKYYQKVCNKVYQAEQIGVHIKPQVLLYFNEKTGHAFSPHSHEDGGNPSTNLCSEIYEIKRDLETAKIMNLPDDSESWKLDKESIKKLESLIENP